MNDLDAFRDEFDLALITSDEHVDPLDSPEEMEVHSAIGVFGYKLKPQIRLKLGDHYNLRSANEKRGSALMGSLPPEEGQDLHDDLQAGRAAFKLEEQIFEVENQRHIDHRHPERGHSYDLKWMCGGNHEDFLSRYSKRVHSAKKLISEKMVENIAAEFGYGYTFSAAFASGMLTQATTVSRLASSRGYPIWPCLRLAGTAIGISSRK